MPDAADAHPIYGGAATFLPMWTALLQGGLTHRRRVILQAPHRRGPEP
jgi:hypothetical protein